MELSYAHLGLNKKSNLAWTVGDKPLYGERSGKARNFHHCGCDEPNA